MSCNEIRPRQSNLASLHPTAVLKCLNNFSRRFVSLRHCGIHSIFSHILPSIHHLRTGDPNKTIGRCGIKGWDICVLYVKSLKTPVKVCTSPDKFDISIKSSGTSALFVFHPAFVSDIGSVCGINSITFWLLNVVNLWITLRRKDLEKL